MNSIYTKKATVEVAFLVMMNNFDVVISGREVDRSMLSIRWC